MSTTTIAQLMDESGVKFGTSGARGLVRAMTPAVCYGYTKAFLRVVGATQRVVVGHDLRPSSPDITRACIAAIEEMGLEAIYAGALPTPAIANFAHQLDAPALVITGSHIPFDRNGIKFYRREGEITKADEQAMLATEVEVPGAVTLPPLPVPEPRAGEAFMARYVDYFGPGALSGCTVAVYEHSSVARDFLKTLLEKMGSKVISLGRTEEFVPIDTEAVRPEDIEQAKAWARDYEFDALFSTDGDADRPLLGDENGAWFRGDVVGILCAHYLGISSVAAPISCNTALERCGYFPRVVRTRIGSPYVIAAMDGLEQPVAGFEANGGFLLGSDVCTSRNTLMALPTRDAILPMLALLCMAREQGVKLSELRSQLPGRFTASDRIQGIASEKSREFIDGLAGNPARCEALLPAAGALVDTNTLDGLRMTFDSGDIIHFRPSGNAPELRCYTESSSQQAADAQCQRSLAAVKSLLT